jgi:protein-S-isoprenylcysteine O-methyltransferase Ste14
VRSALCGALIHALLLSALRALGGGGAPWSLVAALVLAGLAESLAQSPRRLPTGGRWPAAQGLMIFAVVAAALLAPGEGRPAGAALIAAGVGLRVAAIRALGPWFLDAPALAAGQPLVTCGVYRFARHPAAAGAALLALGVALLSGSAAAGLIAIGGLAPLLRWRMRIEDAALAAAWPEAWRRWRRRVGPLAPRYNRSRLPRQEPM